MAVRYGGPQTSTGTEMAWQATNTKPGSRPAFCFGEFRDTHALRTLGRFGTMPRPRPAKRHKFNKTISAPELHFIGTHASGAGFCVFRPVFLDSENTSHKPQTRRSPTCKATSS